jgi:uncharacterized protein
MRACLLFLLLTSTNFIFSQTSDKIKSVQEFQEHINSEFKDPEESPLTPKDLQEFKSLEFFEIDTLYAVMADFVRTPSEPPFTMATSTDRRPVYVKYGEAYFELKGKKYKLNIYQNQELTIKPEYEDYLFLPFTDLTNGAGSYGGGRYIDLKIPSGSTVLIDFNKSYNPYCAYSGRYSCPIPPAENNLKVKIPVGVKAYKK